MKKTLFLSLIIFSSFSLFAQQIATGYVFEDSNGNGKKERNERGIPVYPYPMEQT